MEFIAKFVIAFNILSFIMFLFSGEIPLFVWPIFGSSGKADLWMSGYFVAIFTQTRNTKNGKINHEEKRKAWRGVCFEFDHFAVHQRVLGGRKVEDWILFMFNERNHYDAYQPNIYGLSTDFISEVKNISNCVRTKFSRFLATILCLYICLLKGKFLKDSCIRLIWFDYCWIFFSVCFIIQWSIKNIFLLFLFVGKYCTVKTG